MCDGRLLWLPDQSGSKDCYGHDGNRYDALLEDYEPGATTAWLEERRAAAAARVEAVAGRATEPFVTTREGRLGVGLTRVETLMGLYGLAWSVDSVPGRGVTVRLELAEAWG